MPDPVVPQPEYITPDGRFKFFPNHDDAPDAYDVVVGDNHFYIHSRTLPDLVGPEISTDNMMRSLSSMCGGKLEGIMGAHALTSQDVHIALLQLQVHRGKKELDSAYAALTGS